MKNIVAILLIGWCTYASAQNTKEVETTEARDYGIILDFGAFLSTKTTYKNGGASSRANNLYHFGIGYSKTFDNRYIVSLGPRIDYYSKLFRNDADGMLATIFFQNQLKFSPEQKTFYSYINYGIGPKLSNNFYAGSIFEIGMGWQYKPKFIGKKVHFALGYSSTNIKNVYAEFYSSFDGETFTKTAGDYRLNLSSLALNMGITF